MSHLSETTTAADRDETRKGYPETEPWGGLLLTIVLVHFLSYCKTIEAEANRVSGLRYAVYT